MDVPVLPGFLALSPDMDMAMRGVLFAVLLLVLPQPGFAAEGDHDEAGSGTIAVGKIRLVGNTVFDRGQLEPILAPFEGRYLGVEQIEDLRLQLTRHYVDAGYISSGALVTDLSAAPGDLELRIVEGRLSRVSVSGEHHYQSWYLPELISTPAVEALNVRQLQERLQLLLQDGVVKQLNAQLMPGSAPGESVLQLAVREGPRFRVGFTTADDRPPSVGETAASLGLSARNLFGINDATAVSIGLTRGYESYGLQETLPLSTSRYAVFLSLDKSEGNIVESAIRDLDITSRQESIELGISARAVHSLSQALKLSLSTYYTDTKTYLLGIPFSFTQGVEDGRSTVAGLRGAAEWTYRGASQVLALRSALDVGIDAYGATLHEDGELPDSRFVVWNSQFQYLRQTGARSGEVVLRGGLQRASRGLLPAEKFSIGGIDSVRGYATNTRVRDQGFVGSAEYRHRLFLLRLPGISQAAGDGALKLAAFFDAGAASEREGRRDWLSSVGAGLRWDPAPNCNAVFYRGIALHDLESEGDSLQDHGIHFRVAYETGF